MIDNITLVKMREWLGSHTKNVVEYANCSEHGPHQKCFLDVFHGVDF